MQASRSFETQSRHHQKSKTGVSVDQQKGLMSSKIIFKKNDKQANVTKACNELQSD